jgi:pimeloyl-ACP methyl ester carboxylesterase
MPVSVRVSPEDALELVIEQLEGVGRAEDPDQDGTGADESGSQDAPAFLKLRKIKQATTREGQIDNLVEMLRTFGSPGYPFAGDWARSVATVSHDRSPRDPKSTQRQLVAGRAQKIPPILGIHVPALVFCGREDPIIKPKASQDLAARIPGAKLVIYPGMGHSLPAELWPDMVGRITALAGLS